jgi:hypothetical protein
MAIQRELTVSFDEVFSHGAWLVSAVQPVRDYDRSSREVTVQEVLRDEAGQPVLLDGEQQGVWQVEVMDGDEEVTGETKKVRVKIVGLRVSPWVNRDRCRVEQGKPHRCGARQAWSYWATGLRAVNEAPARERAQVGNGRAGR